MGDARWNPTDWGRYAACAATKSRAALYSATGLHPDLDPRNIALRESVDSDANPASTPVIVALDVTGSMGRIPDMLVRGPLGTLVEEIIARRPVSDPHLMFMGVGDADYDRAPLQVTQFEADLRIADQMRQIYLEGGGGGNAHESYHLPWYFAGLKTRTDAMLKRGKKGYLFTLGDEEAPPALTPDQAERVFGERIERAMPPDELLEMAGRAYHVFHLVVEEGSHYRAHPRRVMDSWTDLLGQRVLRLSDHTKLAEVIVSAIQANEGMDRDHVARSWSGATGLVVARAIGEMVPADGSTGVVRL